MSILDKLPFKLPFGSAEENYEYYFALNITASKVTASLWGVEGKRLRIVSSAEGRYEGEDDLVEASNRVLDEALADLPYEIEKILFGVPEHWLIDDDLKPEYLTLLRKMVKELDVSPMAFVSSSHAICHYLQKQSGAPTTAILVEVGDPLTVTVVKGGKILASKQSKRSDDLPKDIERVLLGFSDIEVMPAKIITYGDENPDKFREELASFSWMAQLPFLHLPKIENLDRDSVVKAIAFAGASELLPDNNINPDHIVLGMGLPPKSKKLTSKLPEEEDQANLATAGFVAGDIEEVSRERRKAYESQMSDEDLASRALAPRDEIEVPGKLAEIKSKYLSFLPVVNLPSGVKTSGKILFIPVAVLVLLVLAALFIPKARVTVFVDPRTIEKDATIIADPTITASDEGAKKIPGKIVESSQNGTQKAVATGKKQIGDPARGAVIIYNKTSASKNFSAGTVLVADGKEFKLDSSVNIASQSAVEGGISFGKATANVTALVIGPDGNLAAGKELTIKDQSSSNFSAKVDSAFSGGVSKDVTVVTSDDQKKLLATLLSELKTKARDELQGKLTADMKVLEEGLGETIVKQQYSKNVGDQAADFSLNLTVNLKGTAYNESDLKTLVSKLVETNLPEGYDLDLSKTETQADVSKIEKDGRLIFAAKFRAKLMPKFDKDKITKDIVFKTPAEAAENLRKLENVIGSDVVITPSLPGPLKRLPLLTQNISIEVTSK